MEESEHNVEKKEPLVDTPIDLEQKKEEVKEVTSESQEKSNIEDKKEETPIETNKEETPIETNKEETPIETNKEETKEEQKIEEPKDTEKEKEEIKVEVEETESKEEVTEKNIKNKPSINLSKIKNIFQKKKSETTHSQKPSNFNEFYNKNYKKLILLPLSLLFISIILIIVQVASTGDFINKDVTLKGGVTITIPLVKEVDVINLKTALNSDFSNNDISIRSIKKGGQQIGLIVSVDIDGTDKAEVNNLVDSIGKNLNVDLSKIDHTTEVVGSSLGASFFKEIIKVLIIAFLFMGLVVFLYFRKIVPSLAIILAAGSDIIITLAVVNLLGIKLSTAGIAAFLMLIGYAVDTNILLSTKLLKRKEGTINKRIVGALRTGLTMTITTLSAILVALLLTQSDVIKQIMTILLIGLIIDMLNTWIQNASILKWYLEKKNG